MLTKVLLRTDLYILSNINVLVQLSSEEQQSFYRLSDDQPISDHSLLPEALQSACAGLPLHWMEPVSAPDALLQSGTCKLCQEKLCYHNVFYAYYLFISSFFWWVYADNTDWNTRLRYLDNHNAIYFRTGIEIMSPTRCIALLDLIKLWYPSCRMLTYM